MNDKDNKPGFFSAEFWIETLGWRRDERIDHASQQNMKVLTWVYVIEFFLMGIYQAIIANYQVAAPLLVVASAITAWFAFQHRRYADDEYGLAQIGKQYDWSGKTFAVGAMYGFLAMLIILGEMDLLWSLMIIIPSVTVIVLTMQRQMFGKRTWLFIGSTAVFGGLFGFLLGTNLITATVAWGFVAVLAIFFAAIYWLYYKQ